MLGPEPRGQAAQGEAHFPPRPTPPDVGPFGWPDSRIEAEQERERPAMRARRAAPIAIAAGQGYVRHEGVSTGSRMVPVPIACRLLTPEQVASPVGGLRAKRGCARRGDRSCANMQQQSEPR